jgi:anti-sigma regulatory factor (Ser/Thr protein kinase)
MFPDFGYDGPMASSDPPAGARGRPIGSPAEAIVDQVFTEDGLYSMRAAVAAHASAWGAGPDLVERLLIVASELASNAVRHGGGTGRLRLWRERGGIHVQVSDGGPGMADAAAGTSPPDPQAISGRGLWICRRIVPDLRILTGPDGTTATAVLELDGTEPAPPPHRTPPHRDPTPRSDTGRPGPGATDHGRT